MDPRVAADDTRSKDPHMPAMARVGEILAPRAPQDLASAHVPAQALADLALKLASTAFDPTTDWVAKRLSLSLLLTGDVMEKLCQDGLARVTRRTTETKFHYEITQRGRDQAARLLDVCRYIGPAPVGLESYAAMLRWQFANTPAVRPEHVGQALSGLILDPKAARLAGLAVSSGRSLFVYGPPGNGKSTLGRQLHAALQGDCWIPYCLSVENTVIRLYDEQIHQRVPVEVDKPGALDQRWVRIRRPLVIVGGELTLESLDLVYSPTLRIYEAPPHLKANGGVFLVDDFGRERVAPDQLLNRFITPMEHQVDYFTLATGQKIQLPLRHVLVIATNLSLETVTDPAFLRRMGYRLYLGPPTPDQYRQIFQLYAQRQGAVVAPEVIDGLLERYRAEKRELRACEPRDLIARARDICRFQNTALELTPDVLDLAWVGYFGSEVPGQEQKEPG